MLSEKAETLLAAARSEKARIEDSRYINGFYIKVGKQIFGYGGITGDKDRKEYESFRAALYELVAAGSVRMGDVENVFVLNE